MPKITPEFNFFQNWNFTAYTYQFKLASVYDSILCLAISLEKARAYAQLLEYPLVISGLVETTHPDLGCFHPILLFLSYDTKGPLAWVIITQANPKQSDPLKFAIADNPA
jgi:hypothetical protein